MRWRTVDGIQTEERADTPLGSYVVRKSESGRWAWCGPEDAGWWFCDTSAEAKRAAQQHFYDECFKRMRATPHGFTDHETEDALSVLGITPPPPEREPLVWKPWGDASVAQSATTRYFVSRVCDNTHTAHARGGGCVRCLLQVGSLAECKAACERDREANR